MPKESDASLIQPKRHPFPIELTFNGSFDDVILRFFWEERMSRENRKKFEDTLSHKADELVDNLMIHYLSDEFKWRTRTHGASKVEVYGDFVTSREITSDNEAVEPFHQLLDVLHDFQPPITLVKIVTG